MTLIGSFLLCCLGVKGCVLVFGFSLFFFTSLLVCGFKCSVRAVFLAAFVEVVYSACFGALFGL